MEKVLVFLQAWQEQRLEGILVSVAEKRDLGLEYPMVRAKEAGFHPDILAYRISVVNSSQSIQGGLFLVKN